MGVGLAVGCVPDEATGSIEMQWYFSPPQEEHKQYPGSQVSIKLRRRGVEMDAGSGSSLVVCMLLSFCSCIPFNKCDDTNAGARLGWVVGEAAKCALVRWTRCRKVRSDYGLLRNAEHLAKKPLPISSVDIVCLLTLKL